MDVLACLAATFAAIALFAHIATVLCAARRCRVPRLPASAFDQGPPVTIIRPVCGVDPTDELTLRSTFGLTHPHIEVLFCCASPDEPAVALVRRLIAEHPGVRARLLIGDEPLSQNPKLNNVAKGWRAASHAWIVLADSNVLMPPDYIARLLAAWTPGTGLVSAPPIGWQPDGEWPELECAHLNTYHYHLVGTVHIIISILNRLAMARHFQGPPRVLLGYCRTLVSHSPDPDLPLWHPLPRRTLRCTQSCPA